MSRMNVGTVSIGAVVDAGGVGTGVDQVAKELDKLPKSASEAERKLSTLTRGFLELAKATKVANQAAGLQQPILKPVPGGSGGFIGATGNRTYKAPDSAHVDFRLGLDALNGARQEAKDFQEAERIHQGLRNKSRTLLNETAKTYGVLGAGKLTREQRLTNGEDRERKRVAREDMLTGDAYGLLGDDGLNDGQRARRERRQKRERALQQFRQERFRSAADRRAIDSLLGTPGGRGTGGGADIYGLEESKPAPFLRTWGVGPRDRSPGGAAGGDGGGVGGALAGAASLFANKTLGIASGVAGFFGGIVQHTLGYSLSRMLGAVSSEITGFAHQAIESTRQYEEQLVSFGVLTGSKSRGTALVGSLQQLAIETPFKSSELLDQAKLLLSYGVAVDDVKDTLSRLGDVASGAGVDLNRLGLAYGQVIAKGRLQGGELRQFTEAGVGVGDFKDAYNESAGRKVGVSGFLGLVEQGQVSSRVIERAFERMTSAGGRFFGLMEARSQTVSGRIQALTESIELFSQKVGTSFFKNTTLGTFFDKLGKDIRGIDTSKLDGFFRGLDRTAGPFLGRVGRGVGNLFDSPKMPDWGAVDDGLKHLTDTTIPSLLDGGKVVANVFLEVGREALNLADTFGRVGSYLYEKFPDKVAGAKRAASLDPSYFFDPLAMTSTLLDAAGKGRENRPLAAAADRIGKFQADLAGVNVGQRFRAGARSSTMDQLIGALPTNLQDTASVLTTEIGRSFTDPANLDAVKTARRLNQGAMLGAAGGDDGFRGWRALTPVPTAYKAPRAVDLVAGDADSEILAFGFGHLARECQVQVFHRLGRPFVEQRDARRLPGRRELLLPQWRQAAEPRRERLPLVADGRERDGGVVPVPERELLPPVDDLDADADRQRRNSVIRLCRVRPGHGRQIGRVDADSDVADDGRLPDLPQRLADPLFQLRQCRVGGRRHGRGVGGWLRGGGAPDGGQD